MKSKKKRSNDAVSDIIGTVLMLGMAISLIALVYISVLSYPFTPSPVSADLIGSVDGNSIIIEHHGGDALGLDTEIVITVGSNAIRVTVEDYLDDKSEDGLWNIGERVVYSDETLTSLQVKVAVVDTKSNSAILMGILQEGGTIVTPSLATSVDAISPYIQTSSPFTVNATGDSGLDNVTLYYRWSEDNWTIGWTTLTYDDFEAGFGNYTDGGNDCSLYSDGTYAHQGSNAADIQGNSGDASSFYHTLGIDVDTPGYTQIKVDFWFYADGMGSGHDFWVQYFDGNDWNTVADYDEGVDFVNGQFYHEIVWINESDYTFPSDMKIKFICDANNNNNDVYIDEIYVNAIAGLGSSTDWDVWNDGSNPDTNGDDGWSWNFDFPNSTGYYEFYSIGMYDSDTEDAPSSADAICKYEG